MEKGCLMKRKCLDRGDIPHLYCVPASAHVKCQVVNREGEITLKIEERERPRIEKKDESYLGISSTEIYCARRLSQALSLLIFFSLCTFYFAVNTDLVMDLCLEILRFTILAMS